MAEFLFILGGASLFCALLVSAADRFDEVGPLLAFGALMMFFGACLK